MTDLREQIAKSVYAGMKWACANNCGDREPGWTEGGNSFAQDEARKQSDAILELLKGAVKQLQWEAEHDFYCSELFECETGFGKYSAFLAVGNSDYSWCLEDGPDMPEQHGLASLEAAKAAAQADYTRRILSALGLIDPNVTPS